MLIENYSTDAALLSAYVPQKRAPGRHPPSPPTDFVPHYESTRAAEREGKQIKKKEVCTPTCMKYFTPSFLDCWKKTHETGLHRASLECLLLLHKYYIYPAHG